MGKPCSEDATGGLLRYLVGGMIAGLCFFFLSLWFIVQIAVLHCVIALDGREVICHVVFSQSDVLC